MFFYANNSNGGVNLSVKLENGMVVELISGEHKGKLGVVHGNITTSPTVTVCVWQGMVYADLIVFHEDELILYQNPHKFIRSLAVGDEMVILEQLRISYNAKSRRKEGETLLIDELGETYDHIRTFYGHTENDIRYQYVEENIDIPATNRLLVRKYGRPLKKNALPVI